MSGHTPGPWVARRYLGRDDNWFVRGPRDERVCGQGSGPVSEANARRIVACVNALEGLDPAGVADVVAALEHLLKVRTREGVRPQSRDAAEAKARTALARIRGEG